MCITPFETTKRVIYSNYSIGCTCDDMFEYSYNYVNLPCNYFFVVAYDTCRSFSNDQQKLQCLSSAKLMLISVISQIEVSVLNKFCIVLMIFNL